MMDATQLSAWQMLLAGGPVMAPILLCSVFAVMIITGKFIYLVSIRGNISQLRRNVFEKLKDNNIREAVAQCELSPSPIAAILKVGILKFGMPAEEIKEAMEDASALETPFLEKRLNILATIAHITPLLGLLGTVLGLAATFHAIELRNASLSPVTTADLAAGIWQALLTTIAGLIVAIPTFLAYNYLVSQTHAIILEMERSASELVSILGHLSESQASKKGGYRGEI